MNWELKQIIEILPTRTLKYFVKLEKDEVKKHIQTTLNIRSILDKI